MVIGEGGWVLGCFVDDLGDGIGGLDDSVDEVEPEVFGEGEAC